MYNLNCFKLLLDCASFKEPFFTKDDLAEYPNWQDLVSTKMLDHFFIFQKNSLHLKTANFSSLKRMSIFTSRKILREKLKLYSASKRV